jgi:hypothetical protein
VITFRNYVVTLVAVFLALAAGVALGGGPLSDLGRSQEPVATAAHPTPTSGYPDTFAAAVATRLYAGGLAHRQVAVLTAPGADPAVVTALGRQIRAAGGQVVATYPLASQLLAAQQKSLVDTLGSQLGTQLGKKIDKSATTYPRIGELLGVAVATAGSSAGQPNADVAAVRQSLVAAKLMTVPRGTPRTAPLVLVVLGNNLDQTIADGVLQGLAAQARGVVAVAATANANLRGLGTDGITKQVSAVDGVETRAGQVAGILALIRAWHAPGGSFGASGSDGAVPLG